MSVILKKMEMQMTMINYVSKNMNLSTGQAMISQNLVGSFSTSSSDFCDLMISALISQKEDRQSRWHGEITLQKSFSQKDAEDIAVNPVGQITEMVLPFTIQPWNGASRLEIGITNVKQVNDNLI